MVTPTRAQEMGPWEGNVDIAQLPEEGPVFASAALLGWLVWSSQLRERQVLGIYEWAAGHSPLQTAFFASAVQLLLEMPADTKVRED